MHGTDGSGPGGPAGKSRLFRPAMAEPVLAPAVVQLSPGDLRPSHRAVSRDAAQGSADPAPALGLSADQQADGRGHGRVPLHSREHVWRSRVLGEAHRHRRWACPRLAHGSGAWEPERCPRPRGERGAAGGPRGTGDVGSTVAGPPARSPHRWATRPGAGRPGRCSVLLGVSSSPPACPPHSLPSSPPQWAFGRSGRGTRSPRRVGGRGIWEVGCSPWSGPHGHLRGPHQSTEGPPSSVPSPLHPASYGKALAPRLPTRAGASLPSLLQTSSRT